jgi:hypothetical protein
VNDRAGRDGAAPVPTEPASPPRRPRNYLAPGERRRLFWNVVPLAAVVLLALGWVERAWLAQPPTTVPAVDTRLEAVAGRPPAGDEIVIEREPEPLDLGPAADLAASRESLARVRDATFFREADEDAWFQTWNTLREGGAAALRAAAPRRVEFREIFGQPGSFRGRLVSMRGTFHRLEEVRAPANDYGIERYWQGWLEPEGGPTSPVVVQSLTVPAGMATGMAIDEPVEVIGYFFKNYAYAASDTVRVAPVIMTLEPFARPRPGPAPGGRIGSAFVTITMAATLLALVAAAWIGSRSAPGGRGSPPATAPVNLDQALAEFRSPTSTE